MRQNGATPARVIPLHPPVARLLVLLPCLNEGSRLGPLLASIAALHPEADLLVVDDGSDDDTAAVGRAAGAEVIRLAYNMGYGAALQTGYKYALERGYHRIVQMDGDGQHPPEEIARLLTELDGGGCDLAVGSRFLGRPCYRIPLARRMGIRFFSWLTSRLVGGAVTDPTSGFQAMNRNVLEFYQQDFYPYDYPDADMLVRVAYAGLRFREVPVEMRAGPPDKSMHSGLSPFYYVYKLTLSLLVTWLSGVKR